MGHVRVETDIQKRFMARSRYRDLDAETSLRRAATKR